MNSDKQTLSLVIPVYNEERNIGLCLKTVAKQTEKPDEVIVVDNNCSDRTVEIAKTFDFVKIIQEKNQGRGYARTAGFNAARGDIIGRIDADSRLSPSWVEEVKKTFASDPTTTGVTGLGLTAFLPGVKRFHTTLFSRTYYWFVHAGFRTITMWGSTMAVSRIAWQAVADKVCLDDNIVHEDQDVSLWIAANGGKNVQNNRLLITTNAQSFRYLPKLLHYNRLFFSTRKFHRENGNLSSSKLIRLGRLHTLPGQLWAAFLGVFFFAFSMIMFPLDYLLARILKVHSWLD